MANLEKFNKHNKMFNIFYSEIFAISVQSFLVPGLFLLCLPPGSRRPPIVGDPLVSGFETLVSQKKAHKCLRVGP